jgi:hypothetical protein
MGMGIKTDTQVKPIGLLPETAFGTPLIGCSLESATGVGASTIELDNTQTYTEDQLKGLRIILKDNGNESYHVITGYVPGTWTATITPVTPIDYIAGKSVIFVFCPIQARISKSSSEQTRSKDLSGTVGGGILPTIASEGGKEHNYKLELELGRDFFAYGSTKYIYSSLLAYALSSDGTFDSSTGEVTLRANSDVQTFTLAWAVEPYDYRMLTGCVVKSIALEVSDDIHSFMKMNVEIGAEDLKFASDFPSYVRIPDTAYRSFLVRSHGNVSMVFRHRTVLNTPGVPTDTGVKVASVLGFSAGDYVTLTNQDGDSEDEEIDTIPDDETINLVGTLSYNYNEWESTLEHRFSGVNEESVDYPITSMEIKLGSGANLIGDVRQDSETPTLAYAGAMEVGGTLMITRIGSTITDMLYGSNMGNRFRFEVTVREDPTVTEASIKLILNCVIVGSTMEEAGDAGDRKSDSIEFKVESIEEVLIGLAM